jgi:predicted transposase YdaD
MSRFNAELRWQAEDEVQTLLELNAEEARIIREQNSRRRTERRAEMTVEGRIQVQEIIWNTNENEESGVNCNFWIQLLASSKSFKNKSTLINYLQSKKYISFAKLLNG